MVGSWKKIAYLRDKDFELEEDDCLFRGKCFEAEGACEYFLFNGAGLDKEDCLSTGNGPDALKDCCPLREQCLEMEVEDISLSREGFEQDEVDEILEEVEVFTGNDINGCGISGGFASKTKSKVMNKTVIMIPFLANLQAITTAWRYSISLGVKQFIVEDVPTRRLSLPQKATEKPTYPSSSSSLNWNKPMFLKQILEYPYLYSYNLKRIMILMIR